MREVEKAIERVMRLLISGMHSEYLNKIPIKCLECFSTYPRAV